ncbi:protein FAR1-RELATED SEQUENCE 5-like [Salvia splendens]|uniref:protein FAR1-RELATED SEQUENCE 5-like n=1 Tax=Salvia splendens TaxID=180675 RepID=UPI001C25817A|nr:protein FAR1-RELATED SEQUENCE 5-like [Salvia splendens]
MAMRSAIEEILVGTKHRWCMWHVTYKLAVKAPKKLLTDDHFKKEFNACVWSDLHEPAEFEVIWNGIIEEYGLQDVEWFNTMYRHRKYWILQFYLSFNNALESQRHSSAKLDYADSTLVPILATDQPFEKHASTLFNDSMFRKVQVEIVEGCNRCRIVGLTSEGMIHFYKFGDSYRNTFVVTHDKNHDSYACECKLFGRHGFLCCHIIYLFKNNEVRVIPDKYAESRWMKTPLAKVVHGHMADSLENTYVVDEKMNYLMKPPLCFTVALEDGRRILWNGETQVVEVHALDVVQTKGSCSTKDKRIISKRKKAKNEFNCPVRRCGKFQELGHHDSRNCNRVKEKELEKEKGKGKEKL